MLRVSILALIAAALAAPALAQSRSSADYGNRSVTVDMSVLDSLGPEFNVPDMNSGSTRRSFNPSTPLGRRTLPSTDPDLDMQPPATTGRGGVNLQPPRTTAPRSSAPRASTSQAKPKPVQQQVSRAASPPSARAPEAPPTPPPAAGPVISPPVMSAPTSAPPQNVAAAPAPSQPPPPAPAPAATAAPTPVAPRPQPELVSPLGPVPPSTPSREPLPPTAFAPPPASVAPPPAATRSAPSPSNQTASLAPTPAPSGGTGQLSLKFTGEEATLSDAAKRDLDGIAARAGRDESVRLQLMAYASGSGESANSARRLSLSRALAVRSYLIDKGVRSTRIDVRALGNRLEGGGDPDRVDVVVGGK